jgi:hypothetical protein
MKSKLSEIRILNFDSATVTDGTYSGQISGYTVTFQAGKVTFQAKADIGVRGMNVPCIVTQKDGKLSVEV